MDSKGYAARLQQVPLEGEEVYEEVGIHPARCKVCLELKEDQG